MGLDNLRYLFLFAQGEHDNSGQLIRRDESKLYLLGSEIKSKLASSDIRLEDTVVLSSAIGFQSSFVLAEGLKISQEKIIRTNLLEDKKDTENLYKLIQEKVRERSKTIITVSDAEIAEHYAKHHTTKEYGTQLMAARLLPARAYFLDAEKKQWSCLQYSIHSVGMSHHYEIPPAGVHDLSPPRSISGTVGNAQSRRETVPANPNEPHIIAFKKK
jgi:hypothetical protein